MIGSSHTWGGAEPTNTFELKKGTVLTAVDNTKQWAEIEGADTYRVAETLSVKKLRNSWVRYDAVSDKTDTPVNIMFDTGKDVAMPVSGDYQITRLESDAVVDNLNQVGTYQIQSLEKQVASTAGDTTATAKTEYTNLGLSFVEIGSSGEWLFDVKEGTLTTNASSRYYKLPVTIDGEDTTIIIENSANATSFVVYAGFFGLVNVSTQAPIKSLVINAGTVMTPVQVDTWTELSDTKIQVLNDLTVTKSNVLCTEQFAVYTTGDVSLDGEIGSVDLVGLKKLQTNAANATTSLAAMSSADINNGSGVNQDDARLLRQMLLGTDTATVVLSKKKASVATNGAMPIIGYDGPDYDESRVTAGYAADFITEAIYDLVADAGINTIVANRNEVGNKNYLATRMLQLAEDRNMQVYINDAYLTSSSIGDAFVDTAAELETNLAKYSKYSSFAGYYIYDEPFKEATDDRKGFDSTDITTPLNLLKNYSNVSGYMNLFPNISAMLASKMYGVLNGNYLSIVAGTGVFKEDDYKSYLTGAANTGVDFLSYDYYLRANDYDNEKRGFYSNMLWAKEVAESHSIPYYTFIQVGTDFDEQSSATSQSDLTTVQEMYLEANAALAMGAQGLNYYSLIQPYEFAKTSNGYDLYRSGLINIAGNANNGAGGANYEYYNAAKKINTFVAKVDEVLMNSLHKAAITTDLTVQSQVSGVTSYGSLSSVSGNTVLVGCFDYCGAEAYMVVNTSCDDGDTGASTTATLNFDGTKSYTCTDMTCTDTSGSGSSLNLTVEAGEAVLVVLN